MSALIQNFDTVEKVIETSANSAGSALEENERYLDSIQGKIDQFNNAMQAMWSNTLDSDMVKGVVAFGTEIIKIIDKIGLLNSALLAFGAYKGFGHLFKTLSNAGVSLNSVAKSVWAYITGVEATTVAEKKLTQVQLTKKLTAQGMTAENAKAIVTQTGLGVSTDTLTKETLESAMANLGYKQSQIDKTTSQILGASATDGLTLADRLLRTEMVKTLATQYLTTQATQALEKAKYALKLAEMGLMNGIATTKDVQAAQAAVEAASIPVDITKIGTTELMGLAFKQLALSVWAATKAVVAFLFTNPIGWIILAIGAIAGGIAIFNHFHKTTEELTEELNDLKSELQDIQSELNSVNSELKTTEDRMSELLAKGSLSFVEKEELEDLQALNNELERKQRLLTAEEDRTKRKVADKAKETISSQMEDEASGWDLWKRIYTAAFSPVGFTSSMIGLFANPYKTTEGKLNEELNGYQSLLDERSQLNNELDGLEGKEYDKKKKKLDELNKKIEKSELYIDEVLSEMKETLDGVEYGYGADEELDKYYNYLYKSEILRGTIGAESDGIAHIFSRPEHEAAKESIDNYVKLLKDGDENAKKEIEKIIKNNDALGEDIKAMGLDIQDAIDYFTLESGGFDSNTIEGITQQYAKGMEVMQQFQSEEKKLIELGNQYNELVNGNVDYNKRPVVSKEKMQEVYPEFKGDNATTWDSDETYGDGKGGVKYTLKFTPILEDGTVLDQNSYNEYINNIFAELDKANGDINQALEYDAANYNILINWQEGAVEYDENNASELDRQLQPIKNKHLELKKTIEESQANLWTIDKDGNFKANAVEFSEILTGMDEDTRETFMNLAEAVKNGEKTWNQAMSEFTISGFSKQLDVLNNEFEGLNNDMFKDAADEISGLIDTVNELQAALEDVANTMDLLNTAEEQMANSNQISVKTALDLMAVTDDYNKVVTVENGVLQLAKGAQDYLTQAKFNSIKVQLEAAATLAETTYQTALASNTELDYADNANVVMTAESIKAEAIGRVSAVVVALGAAMDRFMEWDFAGGFSAFNDTYKSATATVVTQSNSMRTSIAELQRDAENKRSLADVYSFADDYESFKDNYDFDKTPGDKYDDDDSGDQDDAFQRAMDYWENRIGANQARYEQLQSEIDLLESKGQKADASYYEEQIKLENERLSLLQQQKAEARGFLDQIVASGGEGSEEFWEVANTLNEIEGELDSVTQSIVDLQDAIGEIDTYKFEEFNTRLDNLVSKLETIRDLIAPDGEEDWFDDEGNWTEAGVAVLGSHVQQLEMYKQGLEETRTELDKYNKAYSDNTKAYYEGLGIHSEQEYY